VDITLPFYLIHQVFVILSAIAIIKLNLPLIIKLILLILAATAGTFATSIVIRELPVLRILFGMRITKKKPFLIIRLIRFFKKNEQFEKEQSEVIDKQS
jgi:hypothetical protein